MPKANLIKESNKPVRRCLILDFNSWDKVKKLAKKDDRSVSSYLREQIKLLYEKYK